MAVSNIDRPLLQKRRRISTSQSNCPRLRSCITTPQNLSGPITICKSVPRSLSPPFSDPRSFTAHLLGSLDILGLVASFFLTFGLVCAQWRYLYRRFLPIHFQDLGGFRLYHRAVLKCGSLAVLMLRTGHSTRELCNPITTICN